MYNTSVREFVPFVSRLCAASGEIIKSYFRSGVPVYSKDDSSPVTIADKKGEEIMRELIMKEFPEHGILGEEFGAHNPDAEYCWILDPIDGTKSFICGALSFGTLIALTRKNEPVLGTVYQPVLNDLLIGDNEICTINGVRTQLRECAALEEAVLLTTDHLNIEKYKNINRFNELTRRVKLYRNWGDCYGYFLVATGYADIMLDPIMHIWDTAALVPVIRGAGGIITDYHGNDAITGDSCVACGPALHTDLIAALN